ncbi:MAG: GrpB family protein [Oscillospiraceae bacterium]
MARHVTVTEYDPSWQEKFEAEARLIRDILGENCVAIHHIGSTAVPGLAAKPIIDLMPVVHDLGPVDAAAPAFERIGYEYMGEFGIAGRRYLRKGGEEQTHHVHIFAESSAADIQRHLAVRDYLRTHREACNAYAALKTALAEKYPYDIDGYCDGKDAFVKQMEKEALRWSRGR